MTMRQPNETTFLRFLGRIFFFLTLLLLTLSSCPSKPYRAYVQDVTRINTRGVRWAKTPKGVHVWTPSSLAVAEFHTRVDKSVLELSECLQRVKLKSEPIEFERVYVYVPTDWYNSKCSEEQLIPSRVNPELCNSKFRKLGLPLLPKRCEWLSKPTSECVCVCNVRAAIVDMYVVATTPNMNLFKAELARLVLAPRFNNPWTVPLSQCLQ